MAKIARGLSTVVLGALVGSLAITLIHTADKKTQESDNQKIDAHVSAVLQGASDLKIRSIDMFAAMRESNEGIKISKELDEKRKELAKSIEAEEKKLTQTMTEYRNKASMMSDAARNKEEQKLTKMKREYESMVQGSEEELKLVMQQKTEQLGRQIEKAVAQVAQAEGLDIVIDRSTGRVIYASAKGDYTVKVTQEMNKYQATLVAQDASKKAEKKTA